MLVNRLLTLHQLVEVLGPMQDHQVAMFHPQVEGLDPIKVLVQDQDQGLLVQRVNSQGHIEVEALVRCPDLRNKEIVQDLKMSHSKENLKFKQTLHKDRLLVMLVLLEDHHKGHLRAELDLWRILRKDRLRAGEGHHKVEMNLCMHHLGVVWNHPKDRH